MVGVIGWVELHGFDNIFRVFAEALGGYESRTFFLISILQENGLWGYRMLLRGS